MTALGVLSGLIFGLWDRAKVAEAVPPPCASSRGGPIQACLAALLWLCLSFMVGLVLNGVLRGREEAARLEYLRWPAAVGPDPE